MWTPQYDIIVETLTGSEFEVSVTDKDTIGYIKSRIQKYEGIPVGQQRLLYNYKELSDATEMKDIPLGKGSRLKLVLDMKGGPVSARRVINLPDCDNWFDISDVLNTTSRHDPLTMSTPGIKFLVCKDKKSFHRIMKFRSDRKNYGASKTSDVPNSTPDNQDDQWVKDNLQTLEKMHQLRTKLDMKKKLKANSKKSPTKDSSTTLAINKDSMRHENTFDRNREVQLLSIDRPTEINPHGPVVKPKPTKKIDDTGLPQNATTSAEYQTAIISQLMQSDRIGNFYDHLREEEKKSSCGGAVNKFGLNKTTNPVTHDLPLTSTLPPLKLNYEKQFHMLTLPSPPLLSYNLLGKASENNDSYTKFSPPSNLIKNSFTNLAINRPKRKQSSSNCTEETRSKLRENIRRNRSFKTINTGNSTSDELINRPLATNNSFTSILDQLFANSYSRNGSAERKSASKSVQDLVEKLSSSRFASYKQQNDVVPTAAATSAACVGGGGGGGGGGGSDLSSKTVGIEHERELRLPKRANYLNTGASSTASNGFENKLFIDRQQTIGLNAVDPSGCASDFKLENSGSTTNSALDGSFRLYKMSAEVKSKYELPKLLIREDSPVESFHSSDPQLETLTLRGESPKNVLDTYPKLTTARSTIVDSAACDREPKTSNSILKSPWNSHHHSDLGLNNLELNFLNEEFTDMETDRTSTMTTTDNCLPNSGGPFLKIASNLEINSSSWNTTAELDSHRQSQPPSATSLNFINGDLTSSDDEEDVFNSSCCTLHSDPKSKSIELNEFRMMFGSSPTLLNTNYNPVTHTSRLDAVPIQYRRGYSNLNDACLSSSTSDLELFNGVRKKNSSKSASQELPSSFSRHRTTNGSLDFVRSYENLDRTKILRMKNERHRNAIGSCFPDLKPFWDNGSSSSGCDKRGEGSTLRNQFSRERLQEENGCDEPYSFSNLTYDDLIRGCMDGGNSRSSKKCLPIGFPSDESIFNMNLDRFTDDFNLLSLGDRLSNSSSTNNSRSSLVLSELEIDSSPSTIKKPLSPSTSVIIRPTKIPTSNNSGSAQRPTDLTENSSAVIGKPTKIPISATTTVSANVTATTGETENATGETATAKKTPKKQRCAKCNKKLGLIMVMKCHCEKVFCPQHRYAEAHNCSYNFKSEGKKILARENPLVVAQKLPKI